MLVTYNDISIAVNMSKPAAKDLELPKLSWGIEEFWLKSVDLIFSAQKLSSDRKYDCVINYLRKHVPWKFNDYYDSHLVNRDNLLPECLDFNGKDKYLVLRNYILKQDEFNDILQRLKRMLLFSCRDLKPSAFLCVLDTLGGRSVFLNSIKRTFWLARLPRNIQKVMFASILFDPQPLQDRTLENLAAVADGIAAYEKYHSYPKESKLNISLPGYLEHDPEVWFYSLDEAFSANGVTDDELKCQLTIDRLPDDQLVSAALFLTDLPNLPKKYTNLKERIIKTFLLIQNDNMYSFVFRNMNRLSPKALLKFLNGAAAKSGQIVSQLVIRTFWIMLLPVWTQAVLFKLWCSSREPLQDLDIDAMAAVADTAGREYDDKECVGRTEGRMSAPNLDSKEIDKQAFLAELHSAASLQEKIALGMQYCDYMYQTYYKNNPAESIERCTKWTRAHDTTGYTARDHFFEGCSCMFHERYGEFSEDCLYIPTPTK